jgi:Family of unknown function (DUF6491)
MWFRQRGPMSARTPWVRLTAVLLAGCSATAPRDAAGSLDQYLHYAGAPIQRFSYRNSYSGWQVVADYNLVMFVGDDAYLLRVAPPCPQMRLALFMRIRNSTGGTVSRFDRVQLDENNCLIDQIRPIDYRRMRQENPQPPVAVHEPARGSR